MLFRKDNGAEAAKKHGEERSPLWDKARREHLKIEPSCAACAKKRKGLWAKMVAIVKPVQVHHIFPFHIIKALGRGDLETDQRNLITLCESGQKHHVCLGHLGNFQSFNKHVRDHAEKTFLGKTAAEIENSHLYKSLLVERPKDFDLWTDQEKAAFRADLDLIFPLKTS